MARSHYEVLGVPRFAGGEAVRRAYLQRARQLHPDRYVDAGPEQRNAAERSMQEVNEAWRVLGGARPRRRHAARPKPGVTPPSPGGAGDERLATRADPPPAEGR